MILPCQCVYHHKLFPDILRHLFSDHLQVFTCFFPYNLLLLTESADLVFYCRSPASVLYPDTCFAYPDYRNPPQKDAHQSTLFSAKSGTSTFISMIIRNKQIQTFHIRFNRFFILLLLRQASPPHCILSYAILLRFFLSFLY